MAYVDDDGFYGDSPKTLALVGCVMNALNLEMIWIQRSRTLLEIA